MQVLGELLGEHSSDTGASNDSATAGHNLPGRGWGPRRRRGSRVRARMFVARPKRARRTAWDVAALKLPDPLLTVPMAIADPAQITADLASDSTPDSPPGPASDSTHVLPPGAPAGRGLAIDLSDQPKLIVRPDPQPMPPPRPKPSALPPIPLPRSNPPGTFIPAPIVTGRAATPSPPPGSAAEPPGPASIAASLPASIAASHPASALLSDPGAATAPAPAVAPVPRSVRVAALDLAADLGPAALSADRNQLPDPVQLATEPSRLPEAMLAAVLGIVASLTAWGTAAPREVWIPLAVLPAVGLIAMLLPGGSWARTARAGALLAAAAALPVMAPAMTPVTLVVALAAVALYPMLVNPIAGRVVTGMAIGCLAAPLITAALADGPTTFLRFLLTADGDSTTAIRLALSSGILVVALVGGSTMAARRTLTRTASLAVTRERTARAATARLGVAASSDAVTGLPNRESLLRALTITLADSARLRHPSAGSAGRSGRPVVGLMLIEMERFAQLADSLGSATADDAAVQVARRLRTGYPAPAFLARVSRYQFALLVPDGTKDQCGDLARAITALMSAPVRVGNRDLSITCSMGAVLAGPGLRTADDLLQAADEATRAAQRSGRSRWVMFDQVVRGHSVSQASLELELRDAVRLGAIEVAFQPVMAFGTHDLDNKDGVDDRIVGTEVLARWARADGTLVEPAQFIPTADELGLGVILGGQLIRQALEALTTWRHEGVAIDQVWIVLAPSQLEDPEFAHEVAAQLAIRGLASSCLVLEISAGQLIESEQCLATLTLLRSLGIAVALTDFGCRGTSLSALRRLPISAVKLDASLATELGRQDAVPKAMAQLCRVLGLRVVIEGVETMVQLHGARQIQADAVQGPAIARPMSAEDITNLLTLRLPRDFRLR